MAHALTLLVSMFGLLLVGFIEVQNNGKSTKKFGLTIKQAHEFTTMLFSTYTSTICFVMIQLTLIDTQVHVHGFSLVNNIYIFPLSEVG